MRFIISGKLHNIVVFVGNRIVNAAINDQFAYDNHLPLNPMGGELSSIPNRPHVDFRQSLYPRVL